MKSIFKLSILLLYCLAFFACKNTNTNSGEVKQTEKTQYNYISVADTIITDVVIKNPGNDEWIEYCLRNLKKEEFVNDIFKLVYNGDIVPHDFFSNRALSIEEVKELEKSEDYSRDNIAKVQFEESWEFDKENLKMKKQVQSMMLAYEIYHTDGSVKGYKPIFKIYFK